jgi:hypothetical protein
MRSCTAFTTRIFFIYAQLYRAFTTRGPGVSKPVAEHNVAFLRSFAHYDMRPKVPLLPVFFDALLPPCMSCRHMRVLARYETHVLPTHEIEK